MEGDSQNFRPPVLVGERVAWLGSGSGLPQPSIVRWIGRIPEITAGWTVGIELDTPMPVGGIDGTWRKRKLFSCEPKRGLLVPIDKIMKQSSLLKTRHSLGESFYGEGTKPVSQQSQDLIRKLSLPQSASSKEFLSRVLPPAEKNPNQPKNAPSEVALSFKAAVTQLQSSKSDKSNENTTIQSSSTGTKPAPLTIENVKTLDSLGQVKGLAVRNNSLNHQTVRQQTLDELEKFKKHLDELERIKIVERSTRSRRKKVGKNPESLYDLAKPTPELEESLFLRIIGERNEAPRRKTSHSVERPKNVNHFSEERVKSPEEKRRETVKTVILEEQSEREPSDEPKNGQSSVITKVEPNERLESVGLHITEKPAKNRKDLDIKEAVTLLLTELDTPLIFEYFKPDELQAEEKLEKESCNEEVVVSSIQVESAQVEETSESVSQPTPTIRKKRQKGTAAVPPVPYPRRKFDDATSKSDDHPLDADTSSVLYEPPFLKAYLEAEADYAMSDVRGTFRRIDEDELDRRGHPNPPTRRLLTTSVSVPGGTRKGLFSFFRWFRKNKPRDDLDLEAFDAPSVASSPLFTHSRLANAESVDTLYSIATVSSFAFVSGAQYQSALGSDRRKKRRAPPPPPTPTQRRDVSLPSTLEGRAHQQHRRSASESYKDRRSGAFAHVHGKRRAPPPPVPPPRDRLYPSLSSVRDGSLSKKKRPAPLPPEPSSDENELSVTKESDEPTNLHVVESRDEQPKVEPLPVETSIHSKDESVVCNDTLRLERGVLKPNKVTSQFAIPPDVAKIVPSSPVSPRPWYKRKSLEKRKEKINDDWMPEVGIARPPVSPETTPLKFNFFSRGEDKKKEEKRKSGLSLLANISELDREAAEICRKEQAHQQQLLDNDDAMFYADAVTTRESSQPDIPKRNSTKELISLFNSIGNVTKITHNASAIIRENGSAIGELGRDSDRQHFPPPLTLSSKPEIKTAAVVDTKDFVGDEVKIAAPDVVDTEAETSKAQALYDLRTRRQHSASPTVSTIAEISEPSSSATTLNQYAEAVWTCTRCTLENIQWKNRCDACSACKPNYNPAKTSDKRKSEMELEIDWERELQKYFPLKKSPPKEEAVLAKLTLSKAGDVVIKTETNQADEAKEGDLDELRRKRLAFFMKSLGNEAMISLQDAAGKKSLDETEKLKLKGMLKEMKDSLPKYEGVINNTSSRNLNTTTSGCESLPDVTHSKTSSDAKENDAAKYGAIRKIIKQESAQKAEALLVTTTTVLEDIIVRKKNISSDADKKNDKKEDFISVPVQHFSTVGLKNGEPYTSLGKARKVGDGPFELIRARDLANIIESKTSSAYPGHVYANYPLPKGSDVSSTSDEKESNSGREVARLATQLTRAAGVAKFKAALDPSDANTLAVNRLLRRLEAAIAAGRHDQAATLARELAGLKVNCSVTRQRPSPSPSPTAITVEMYVEDKVSHQGPIPLRVQRSMTLADLKMKVQTDFQIPGHVQRWILGKQLATEDFRTLEDLGVSVDRCAIFLYLVAPEPEAKVKTIAPSAPPKEEKSEEDGAKGTAGPPLGKGWYYNYEEDRYSYCESDSDGSPERDLPENGKTAAVRVIQKTIDNLREKSKSSSPPVQNGAVGKNEELVLQPAPQAKPFSPKQQRPPFKTSVSLPENENNTPSESIPGTSRSSYAVKKSVQPKAEPVGKIDDGRRQNGSQEPSGGKSRSVPPEVAEENATIAAAVPAVSRPRSRSIFDLIKPQSNDTLKKDLKVISVNAVKETIEKLNRRGEDVTRNGWKCALCTLVNSAARPGCAACTAPRPPEYAAPAPSAAEEELRRLRRDQSLDLPILEPDPLNNDNPHYLQLVNLDSADLVANTQEFECPVCFMPQAIGEGVVLRECLHTFCRACLVQTVEFSEEAEVKCPFRDANYSCESVLQQREIKALVPRRVFEQHLARSVAQAENRMGNAFHCKTPDCQGWCILEDNVNEFRCPVCSHVNCLTCQAIHEGLNCRAYQDKLRSSSDTNVEAKRTRSMLEDMVQRGDAMACPTCQVVLMKKWGCDWLRCSMCKTEICWVTRGPRWGPAGKGDTSAGCQCGVNGVKCHPKCNYCH